MKTLAAGGAEAFAACARIVLWAISFHFVTSLGAGSAGATASATPAAPPVPVAPAPAPTTKTRAATARTPTTQAKRRILNDVMTHLLLDDLGFVHPSARGRQATERASTNGLIAAPFAIA